MKTDYRELMKVRTAMSTEDNEPLLTIKFVFDHEFKGNSYEFQHSMVEQVHSALGEVLMELQTKAIWQQQIEEAESNEDLRDVARDMAEKIDDGMFDDDGGAARKRRNKLN